MKHDEKEFLTLLQRYGSEENRRARRNTAVISFLVIAAHILGIRLTDIRALGADITSTNVGIASGICLALLVYWSLMFAVTWLHDREIEKERRLQGQEAANVLLARYGKLLERKQKNPNVVHPDWHAVKQAHAAYERQIERTQKAKRWGTVAHFAEIGVPVVLAIAAAGLLTWDIIQAIRLANIAA